VGARAPQVRACVAAKHLPSRCCSVRRCACVQRERGVYILACCNSAIESGQQHTSEPVASLLMKALMLQSEYIL
jgi:hypothetical protein